MSREDTDRGATTCDRTWSPNTKIADETDGKHDVEISQSRATGFLNLKQPPDAKCTSGVKCSGGRSSERPKFPYPAGSRKADFVLSSSDVSPPVQVLASINRYLRNYQRDGVKFMYNQFKKNCGSVLCDESGLGKRVQVVAFLCAILGKGEIENQPQSSCRPVPLVGAVLVVCPASVMDRWICTMETWSYLSYAIYAGSGGKSASDANVLKRARKRMLDVVLTDSETAAAHVGDLNSVDWLVAVRDGLLSGDAQMVTVLSSLTAQRRVGLFDLAITEIRFSDLWILLDWVKPNGFGTLQCFQSSFGSLNHTDTKATQVHTKLTELEKVVESCVLGRTRAMLRTQLPNREDYVVLCPISELQASIYQSITECDDVQLIMRSGEACDCFSGHDRGECCYVTNGDGISWKSLVSDYMTLLTKCANHLGLLLPATSSNHKHRDKSAKVCREVFSKYSQFLAIKSDASFLTLSDPHYCGKMQAVEKLLLKLKREHAKVVLFCHSVQLLNVLEDFLVCRSYTYCRLDGSSNKAHDTLKTFNADPDYFAILVSRKCEGMSLSITGANSVIIFDPNYDLTTEVQSEKSVLQLGQARDVIVYHLFSQGTIEEALYVRENHKEQLQHNKSDVEEQNKDMRYFNVSSQSGKKASDFASIFRLQKSGLSTAVDWLSKVQQSDVLEGCLKLIHEPTIGTEAIARTYSLSRGSSDIVNSCVRMALKDDSIDHISTVVSASCSGSIKSASFVGSEENTSSSNESLPQKELFTFHNVGTMKPRDSGDFSKQDLLLQKEDGRNSLPHSPQPSRGSLEARTERKRLPSSSGGTYTLNMESQVTTSHVTSEPAEELYDGATVCSEASSAETESTYLPTPCSSPSQGSVSLGLSPSPGILQHQAIANLQFHAALEKSPGGLQKFVFNGAAIADELFEGSVSSSVSTTAELSEEPPSPKRKFLPFDSLCKVEVSDSVCRATGTLPRSDIDVLFEL